MTYADVPIRAPLNTSTEPLGQYMDGDTGHCVITKHVREPDKVTLQSMGGSLTALVQEDL